ncbi:MgtC/SapB family protein, partial [Dietzia sp. DQ11-38-2]|uniref:MgtC/SapB family protein n=1 Tax=Dietzia sp. DQ11-38-2 TaxID=2711155 RepID=UPI0015F8F4F2
MVVDEVLPLLTAAALGLAIGIERERSPEHRSRRIGARTFPLFALAGAIGALLGPVGLAVALSVSGAAILAWYWRVTAPARVDDGADDVGITTMAAAIVTTLLGALSVADPALAVALAVVVVMLLAAKHRLHDFARHALDDRDVTDAITLLVVAFLVLPLMPDRAFGPYDSLNPRTIWILVVFLTGIGWAGYVAARLLGRKWGLFVTSLAGGFVSGTASTAIAARAGRGDAAAR